ncbi:MAG: heavy metal sensor histidine kinase [Hydrogenophilaceae bacterium]
MRLTLLYTFLAAIMLATTLVFLDNVISKDLGQDEFYFVADRVHLLEKTLMQHGDDQAFLDHEVNQAAGSDDFDQHYIFHSRILDELGNKLIETAGMDTIIRAEDFPPPTVTTGHAMGGQRWRSPDGRYYVLLSSWASSGENGPPRLIQVALDESDEKALLATSQYKIYLAIALAILLFAWVSVYVAQQGMRPLYSIASAAERITANQLNERLESEHLPGELIILVESFNNMLIRLEDSFDRMAAFSSDIAHELRAPLHNLMGQTEVALTQSRTAAEYQEILESNMEEFQRLAHMINGLLFLARAESPHMQIERTTFDVREELERVRDFHQAVAEEKGISLQCHGQGRVNADLFMFRRALANLASNALRYTLTGGTVDMRVSEPEDGCVEVAVQDTGSGIAAEHMPKIFDRLYRPDRAHDPNDTGAGLGLAIVKSIMHLHGGKVGAESVVGKGSTFTLTFPVVAPARHDTRHAELSCKTGAMAWE